MTSCATPTCVHCAVSRLLQERPPLALPHDACCVGQVIADIIASIDGTNARKLIGLKIKLEVVKMMDEAIAGAWSGEPAGGSGQ